MAIRILKVFGFLFSLGFIALLGAALAASYLVYETSKSLPSIDQLAKYEPPVMSRVHAGDGSLLAEYADQRRLFVPINAVPDRLIQAFLSAEDKNFYKHNGLDWRGIARAVVIDAKVMFDRYVRGRRGALVGASTITQQVTKNFLLSSERTAERKLKEAILATRIEKAFSKDKILELYLNEIYLGKGAYGVAGAALTYFGKSLRELDLAEMAYLAALPKGPNNYDPFRYRQRAVERRNWVLGRMLVNGYISAEEHDAAVARPLEVTLRPFGARLFAAESFTEEVRREVTRIYSDKRLLTGGLSVRTTLDPKTQIIARQALTAGLIRFDREHGWRGPLTTLSLGDGDWGSRLAKVKVPDDIAPWRAAVVLEVSDEQAVVGLQPKRLKGGKLEKKRERAVVPLELMKWARRAKENNKLGPKVKKVGDVLNPGDVVLVAPSTQAGRMHLVQMPEVEGALIAMDPHTGRVLAMVGGFSYGRSQFNRAVQAKRQPGSAIKPFVYAAALENGYTPASVVMDAPIEIRSSDGKIWRPRNYTKKFYGPSTLRIGLEQSRNVMTVRLANDLGIAKFKEMVERLGIYDNMLPVLSMSLGSGETTLMRMTRAYAMLANGGKEITATLIDRIQDRYGRTIYRHDKRRCPNCKADEWRGQGEPEIIGTPKQVLSPYTAYQMTWMLQGVVENGTGQALKSLGRPVAGKTGTTSEERDAWFIGYVPDLVVGVYVGYDRPRPMGREASGGHLAAPIVRDFLKVALKDTPSVPFRAPPGIQYVPIDPKTGQRAAYGDKNVILEAFKPGVEPGNQTVVIGGGLAPAGGEAAVIEGGLTTGTGGLY